jgi:asparagine synthase (glutamine-hydrolysing)
MCGIFCILNNTLNTIDDELHVKSFQKGRKRGPDNSHYKNVMINTKFGFHRLSINGLNNQSDQPLIYSDIALICNGEIYNYKQLYKYLDDVVPFSDSDCEVIIHLYLKYGIEHTLQMLDGVFAFCLLDYRIASETSKMYIARDPYGIRPLYIMKPTNSTINNTSKCKYKIVIASELKAINDIYQHEKEKNDRKLIKYVYNIDQCKPGSFSEFEMTDLLTPVWTVSRNNVSFHQTSFSLSNVSTVLSTTFNIANIYMNIQNYLKNAVYKRCKTTDRGIACLLSGGLDSSLITALVNSYYQENNLGKLETYSIGIEGSEDLKYAKVVASYLGTNHTEIALTESDFINAIPDVIHDIESYDTTTVRASIGNWLVGKYISEHSNAKVVFNGDGSDELCGGYLYMNYAPDMFEFDKECKSLLKNIYTFDVLRSDKCISSHGLEPRTPFLDREWVQYYLSIPLEIRSQSLKTNNMSNSCPEKYLLRNAFDKDNYLNHENKPLLPDSIIKRKKEAFSDGVSQLKRSLYEIIDAHASEYVNTICEKVNYTRSTIHYTELCELVSEMQNLHQHNMPTTAEQFYYRHLFESYYPGLGHILPYFWMPKYVGATDSSARTLTIYNK